MFLATTSLSEFWDLQEDLLLLGPWCLDRGNLAKGVSPRGRMMASPWDDPKRYGRAACYLEVGYERLLGELSRALDEVHGASFGPRYWRILLGPWLIHFLHASYDRYIHLRAAFEQEPSLTTWLLDRSCFRLPRDSREAMDGLLTAPYNLQIISELLEGMGHRFPSRAHAPEDFASPPKGQAGSLGLGTLIRRGTGPLRHGARTLLRPLCQAALFHTDLPQAQVWSLAWRSRMRILPLELPSRFGFLQQALRPDGRRRRLAELPAGDEFERLFIRLLSQNLPAVYWEGWGQAREATLRGAGRALPPVLVSSVGWYFHEPFQFLAAEAALTGRRLISVQHGGGYGIYRFSPQEAHERRLADRFLCWGWADGSENLRNAPSPKLSRLLGRGRRLAGRRVALFVASTDSQYTTRFYSAPQGSRLAVYFEWQKRFLQALPETMRPRLFLRRHPYDFGHGFRERLFAELPWVRRDKARSYLRRLLTSDLVIVDHLATTILEALAADVPTIAYWNPDHWTVREDALPYLHALRQAGILWDSPEEAARQAAQVWSNPRRWWSGAQIQEARLKFIRRFAFSRLGWKRDWAAALAGETPVTVTDSRGARRLRLILPQEVPWFFIGKNARARLELTRRLGRPPADIGSLLTAQAESLRQPYLDFVAKVGQGQTDSLTWWATRFSWKIGTASDFFLLLCYQAAALALIRSSLRPGAFHRLVVVEDPWLLAQIKSHLRSEGCPVRFHGGGSLLLDRFRQAAAGLMRRIKWLMGLAGSWAWQRIFWPSGASSPAAAATAAIFSPPQARSLSSGGGWSDPYLPKVSDWLSQAGWRVLRFCLPEINGFERALAERAAYVRPLILYATPGAVLRSLLAFWRPCWPESAQIAGMPVARLCEREWWREAAQAGLSSYRFFYECFRRFVARERVRLVVTFFENQPWEKLAASAAREKGARLVGIQTSAISRLSLSYFLGEGEGVRMPLPDTICTSGPAPQKLLREGSHPDSRLAMCGSIRYRHLNNGRGLQALAPAPRTEILVVLSFDRTLSLHLLAAIRNAFPDGGKKRGFRFSVRPHPVSPIRASEVGFPARVSRDPLSPFQEDLARCGTVLFANSTAGLEALAQGRAVLRFRSGWLLDWDEWLGSAVPVCTEETLRDSLTALVGGSGASFGGINLQPIVAEQFAPLQEDHLKMVLAAGGGMLEYSVAR